MPEAPALRYSVEARTIEPGVSEATSKQAAIRFDTSTGQGQELMGPAELLVSAFAACMLKNVERFSTMLPFSYEAAKVEVTAERQESPPRMVRIQYLLTVTTSEPPSRLDLLHRNIKKFGTIFNTLAAVCEVTGEIAGLPAESKLLQG